MAHAKAFGSLNYEEQKYGWALEVGHALGNWLFFQRDGPINKSVLVPNWRQDIPWCKVYIERILGSHQIDHILPDYDKNQPDLQIYARQDVLDSVRTTWSPTHCAFVIIGLAGAGLKWLKLFPGSHAVDDALEKSSKAALNMLRFHCASIFPDGVQVDAIYNQLKRAKGSPDKTRQLLLDLQKPMVILLVLADPLDGSRLRLLNEQQRLSDSLKQSLHRDRFKIEVLADTRLDNFGPKLAEVEPAIIHFSGHGSEDGLFFSDISGKAKKIEPTLLSRLLSLAAEKNLQGVVMNGCFTADALLKHGGLTLQAVVMEGNLADSAAVAFSQQFYAYLGGGKEFKDAFIWAEASTDLSGTESIHPVFIEPS